MKITIGKISILFVIFAFIMAIVSCFSPWNGDEDGEMGTVIISIGGGISRNPIPYPPAEVMWDELVHVIKFTSHSNHQAPDNITLSSGEKETQPIRLPLDSEWSITVDASRNGIPYAQGSSTENVIVRSENPGITISMSPVLPDDFPIWLQDHQAGTITGYSDLNAAWWEGYESLMNPGNYTFWFTDNVVTDGRMRLVDNTTVTLRSQKPGGVTVSKDIPRSYIFDVVAGTLVLTDGVNLKGLGPERTDFAGGPVIYVTGGTFNMEGGSISENVNYVVDTTDYYPGGGVIVAGGTFNMSGGTISDNTAQLGGGVFVERGTFNMTGGTIGGTISGNTAVIDNNTGGNGGGVYVTGDQSTPGTFNMSGSAVISGNKAENFGGGVFVEAVIRPIVEEIEVGIFNKNGGTIAGSNAAGNGLGLLDGVGGNNIQNSPGNVATALYESSAYKAYRNRNDPSGPDHPMSTNPQIGFEN